eukprot:scaffold17780_cov29-Tisochrysis_lutea.AAC.1
MTTSTRLPQASPLRKARLSLLSLVPLLSRAVARRHHIYPLNDSPATTHPARLDPASVPSTASSLLTAHASSPTPPPPSSRVFRAWQDEPAPRLSARPRPDRGLAPEGDRTGARDGQLGAGAAGRHLLKAQGAPAEGYQAQQPTGSNRRTACLPTRRLHIGGLRAADGDQREKEGQK